jgi:multidrug resistance efflux pump
MLILLFLSCNKPQSEEKVKPTYKNISEFVYASVNVVSQNKYQCRPTKSGVIQEIYIKKGEKVKKGQRLFKIQVTADVKNRLDNSRLTVKEVESDLRGRNSKLNSIQIELQKVKEQNLIDSLNYQRRLRLWGQNIGSKSELERALLAYQSSSNRIKTIQLEYDQVKINLENNLEKAKNKVETDRSLLNDFIISSTIDGEVFNVFKEIGEFISSQEIFAEIGSIDNFIINMNIDEVDISKIDIGDTAIIDLQAYPENVYASTLTYISNAKDQATQTFAVEAVFLNRPLKLFNGLAGEANILVERRQNAMVLPSEYLIEGNKVLTDTGEVIISTGVKNLEFVEITNGLDTSMSILKPEIK